MSKTEVVFILDGSASMYSSRQKVVDGYNKFIEEQKIVSGDADVTLVIFDSYVNEVYKGVNIQDVEKLTTDTYNPKKLTSLFDGIGATIDDVSKTLSEKKYREQPDDVVFIILSNGYDYSSTRYDETQIKNKIINMQEQRDWKFVFLGTGDTPEDVYYSLGIKYIGQYTKEGVEDIFVNVSEWLENLRELRGREA